MNTPTKKSPGKVLTPLTTQTPEYLLSSAGKIAETYQESISQTLDRALASPARQSPFFDIYVGEALEVFIDGSPRGAEPVVFNAGVAQVYLSSPTAQRCTFSQQAPPVILSPAPRSPCVPKKQAEMLDADYIENPIVHDNFLRSQVSTLVEDVEESKIPNVLMKADGEFCFDTYYCKKVRGQPPSIGFKCSQCVSRHAFQIRMLKFLKNLYPDCLMDFMDIINLEFIKLAEPELFEALLYQYADLQKAFTIPAQTHYNDIFDLILKPASSALERYEQCSEHYAKVLGVQQPVVGEAIPLAFLIAEYVFNVPCYFAFFLLPLIRSRYRFLHPNYQNYSEEFVEYDDLVLALRIDGASSDFFKLPGTTYAFDQILQFYNEFIDHQNSYKRVFNCLKSIKNIGFNKELKRPIVPEFLEVKDLELFMHFVCKFHPGLEFLRPTADFQVLYAQTVAIRIVCQNDYSRRNKLDYRQFVKSGLCNEAWMLSRSPDTNKLLRYFSYEHFYVIYCQFWQLDSDHDNVIGKYEMMKYGSATCPFGHKCICDGQNCQCGNIYNKIIIDELFSNKNTLGFQDFIKFFIYEENKDLPIAYEYFFAQLDWDGDGLINYNDFYQFYKQMMSIGLTHFREIKQPENMYCQLLDCAKHCTGKADQNGFISLQNIRTSRLCGNFFNVVCNYQKLAQFEIKDPYSIKYAIGGNEKNQFERFCRMMYDLMEDGDQQESLDGAGLDDI